MSRLACLFVLLACASLSACDGRLGAERANVLVIVVDTLRADHLGCYGYDKPTSPRLDALASGGVRFEQARAASSWTLPSVASLLSGVYPAVHGAEQSDSVLPEALDTVAEDFLAAGYATAAFSANPAFVTPRQGLSRGFERFEVLHGAETDNRTAGAVPADASLTKWVLEATADAVTKSAGEWLASRDPAKPFFLYVHYFDPHAAYTPPPDLALQFGVSPTARLTGDAQWKYLLAPEAPPGSILSVLHRLYDAEIAATDRAIGALLDSMPASVRGSTIVVVTSDHGEEFGEHGGVQHGRTLFDELVRVPLLVTGPGIPAGRSVRTPVSLTGLRATLTELAHLPAASTGIEPSLVPRMESESAPAAPVYADLERRFEADLLRHRRALVEGSWKLLVDPDRQTVLHDLAADPQEKRPVGGDARASAMKSRIVERDVQAISRRTTAPPRRLLLDPAKREQLKALGYLQ